MNPFDYTKAFSDFFTVQSQALMQAQEQAGKAFAEGMQALASGQLMSSQGLSSLPTDLSAGIADVARASQAMMDLWSAAGAMSRQVASKLPSTGGDPTIESVFGKVSDPRQWMSSTGTMDDVLGRMAEGPRFADLWQIERRYAQVLQAWMLVRRRELEHNAVVLKGWLEAGQHFAKELGDREDGKTEPLDAKAALALWTETANTQLIQTQRSETFLSSQREMIRATTELRLAQQELVEHFGKQYGFPTRTELDDVHRTVTELRRELRTLKRELRDNMGAPDVPAPMQPSSVTSFPDPANRKRRGSK